MGQSQPPATVPLNPTPVHTVAAAPFDNPKTADVVLLTSDRIRFHVYANILSIASPFFTDLFAMGKDVPVPSGETSETGLPVVPVTEDSKVMDDLLRVVYPVPTPTDWDIHTVTVLLQTADKYQMESVKQKLCTGLTMYVDSSPLQTFALACRWDLEGAAKASAQAILSALGPDEMWPQAQTDHDEYYVAEMTQMSAGAYSRLRTFLAKNARYLIPGDWTLCRPYGDRSYAEWYPVTGPSQECHALDEKLFEKVPGNVSFRSSDGVIFEAHMGVVAIASVVLAERLDVLRASSPHPAPLDVCEDSMTLGYLLRLFYGYAPVMHMQCFMPLVQACKRYDCMRFLEILRPQCKDLLPHKPLAIYFVALACGWHLEARTAAQEAVLNHPDLFITHCYYCPEMEVSSAKTLYNLLKYKNALTAWRTRILKRYQERTFSPGYYSITTEPTSMKGRARARASTSAAPGDLFVLSPPRVDESTTVNVQLIQREIQAQDKKNAAVRMTDKLLTTLLVESQCMKRELDESLCHIQLVID